MRKFRLLFCWCVFWGVVFVSASSFGADRFVIDFGEGRSVFRGEPVNLLELIERRSPGYAGERITDVTVYADGRRLGRGGHVELLDDYRERVAEGRLSGGYASLRVFGDRQNPVYLVFEDDVYLTRIEVGTERSLRPLKQKEVRIPKGDIELGSFVKADYASETKRFSLPQGGGYSRIDFRIQIREQYGVIVNAILVLANGRQIGWKTVGTRLANGDNEFPLDVPPEATDIQVSFDHGQGSAVQVFLRR